MLLAGAVFFCFCLLEMKGVAMDHNETAPKPHIYTSHGGSRGSGGGFYSSSSYFSSK
jgi:hypothetical protein